MERIEELTLLYDISQLLEKNIDLNQVAQPIIDALTARLKLMHTTITVLDRRTGEISIDAASGLSSHQKMKGIYRIGEGITGEVVASGKSKIIANIAEDPKFLNRTGISYNKGDLPIAFICIPIKIKTETIGTLSTHVSKAYTTTLEADGRLLTIICSMIAQAIRLRRDFLEERKQLKEENDRLHRELVERFRPANIIGTSTLMQAVFDMIAQVCRSDTTVLIRGESGTGKELIAQAIHYNSHRKNQPFIRVNCGALPETIIESELFGHERGSFTGAVGMRKGRFELAHNGTIFLDEIGDFPAALQVKLLRFLQEREFERVGGNETIRTNVRIITATNQDLEQLMQEKQFREDLYYRLNVFPIHIPPLRERKSDILLLAEHFIAKYSQASHKKIKRISTPAIDMLTHYHWPGNVRELENSVERAVLLSNNGVVHGQHLPPSLQSAEYSNTHPHDSLQEAVEALAREMIIDTLKTTKGNMVKAHTILKISYRILGLRIKKYGINVRDYR